MTIRSRFAAGGMATALALTGVTAAALGTTWAVAAESTTEDDSGSTQSTATSRAERIEEALAGLVEDGTITQEQVTSVAEALAGSPTVRGGPGGPGGPGGHGPGMHLGAGRGGLDVAAETLGLTEEELRTALTAGSTLAQVAQERGVAVEDLVDALVAARQERLTEAVADGRISQEQADELAAALPERVTSHVEQAWEPRGPGRQMRGHGQGHGGHWQHGGTEVPDEAGDL